MRDRKPPTASGYAGGQAARVEATCLYVATKLGDLMDEIVIVGGLVPSLLIRPDALPAGAEQHVGTLDLDVGLALALFDDARYQALAERLREAGLRQDANERGIPTRQRWRIDDAQSGEITVDFLVPPNRQSTEGGKLANFEPDFAAIVIPGLELAFRDRTRVALSGRTLRGETATRDVWVCGPGAFVVLKALAFGNRGQNKDAYDLYYVLRNFGAGVPEVADRLRPLLASATAARALELLRRDFIEHDAPGPSRVAAFLTGAADDELQADTVGLVRQLLSLL